MKKVCRLLLCLYLKREKFRFLISKNCIIPKSQRTQEIRQNGKIIRHMFRTVAVRSDRQDFTA